jgi:hypothetical protein
VHLTFASKDRIGKSKSATRHRGTAFLSIFAILLQAALFGWHHHPFPLSSRGAPSVLAVDPSGGHPTPVLADDDCQICFALSHHSAAPIGFVAAPVCGSALLRVAAVETVWVPVRSYVLFRSRAPPRA